MSDLADLVKTATSGTQIERHETFFIGADGVVKIFCWISGSGPLIVFNSPGWGCGIGYMKKYFLPVSEKYTLLCVNTRGTPPSSQPADETKMGSSDMADDLEALRRYLQLEKMTLMGHSNGAGIIQFYAANYPTRVDKLLLLCAHIVGYSSRDDVRSKFIKNRENDPAYAEALPGMAKAYASTNDKELSDGMAQLMPFYFAHPDSAAAKEWRGLFASFTVSYWAWSHQKKVDGASPMPKLADIQAKTLIVLCDEDFACTEVFAEKLSRDIPDSKLVELKDSGHMPWHEAEEDFWRTLFEFFAA